MKKLMLLSVFMLSALLSFSGIAKVESGKVIGSGVIKFSGQIVADMCDYNLQGGQFTCHDPMTNKPVVNKISEDMFPKNINQTFYKEYEYATVLVKKIEKKDYADLYQMTIAHK